MSNSIQAGYMGNAGATDNTIAGTWARDPFRQGLQPEADQLFRRGMDNTPAGQRIKNLRDVIQSNPGSVLGPQAMGMPGMNIGNVGGMSTTLNPLAGPGEPFTRYIQGMENMQNTDQQNDVVQQPEEREEDLFAGPGNPFSRYMQGMVNTQNKDKADDVAQEPTDTEEPLFSGTGNPFGRYIQALTNMQQTKQAGFNRKTVS